MQSLALLLFTAFVAVALAEGQFYVPRAYYTIDAEGHASQPVPLRRLRRSLPPYPYTNGANAKANANAEANSWDGGSATANANANAYAHATGNGGWGLPGGAYGSSNPNNLSPGQSRHQSGPVTGARGISASSSVGIDGAGRGYYDQSASVV